MYVITQLERLRKIAIDMRDSTSTNDDRREDMTTIIVICDDLINLDDGR